MNVVRKGWGWYSIVAGTVNLRLAIGRFGTNNRVASILRLPFEYSSMFKGLLNVLQLFLAS